MQDSQFLLTQNIITVNEKKNTNTDLNELLVQKPNIRTLGLPLSLYFYNLGDKNKPNTVNEWGIKKPKTYNFIKDYNKFVSPDGILYKYYQRDRLFCLTHQM